MGGRAPASRPASQRGVALTGLTTALVAVMPCAAQAQMQVPSTKTEPLRVDYEAGVSTSFSDNIRLTDGDTRSETIFAPGLTMEASQNTSDVQLQARGRFQYAHYLNNEFDSEFLGDFAGQMNWFVVPERLALVLADYLGQTPVNLVGGLTPGNNQQINVLTVGPSLHLRPGPATEARLDLRFTDTRASDSKEFDGKRTNLGAGIFHSMSATQSVSANLEAGNTQFDSSNDNDYDRYNLFAGYQRASARGRIELAVGHTRLRFKNPGIVPAPLPDFPGLSTGPRPQTQSSPLVRLDANLELAPRSRLSVHARYELTDAANDMVVRSSRYDQPLLDDLTSPNLVIGPNVYRQRRAELSYAYDDARISAYVSPYIEHISYQDGSDFGWKARGAYANLDYRLRPRLDLRVSGNYQNRNMRDIRTDRDTIMRVQLVYAFSRHISGWVGVQQRRRNSDAFDADYRENMAMAGFTYRR